MDANATLRIGGEIPVRRLGLGSVSFTGEGYWGPPEDPEACRRVLRRALEVGVDFVDTADSYGPYVAEELIAETLAPYDGVTIVTKAGLVRYGPGAPHGAQWPEVGRPEYLRQQCEMSLRRLRLDVIDLWQLHRIDSKVPREEQFGLLGEMRAEGKVRQLGLSSVTVDDIEVAGDYFEVATVQNRFNLLDRTSVDVLDHCEGAGIVFIPWEPMNQGSLAGPGGPLAAIAAEREVGPGTIALAWLLRRSPVMLPIPGTRSVAHLKQNMVALEVELSPEECQALDQVSGR